MNEVPLLQAILPYLPTLNATLNGISAVLLVLGYVFIRQGRIKAHEQMMFSAFGMSVLFLTSYVIYHANVGSKPYPGTGIMRTIYLSILIPHVILAAFVPFLAIITLRRGMKMDVVRHKRIARWTLPIWLFVSVTGVIVYAMLY